MNGVWTSWECCKGTCTLELMWYVLEPAHQLNALWRGAMTKALLSFVSWYILEDLATNATRSWSDSAAGVPSRLPPPSELSMQRYWQFLFLWAYINRHINRSYDIFVPAYLGMFVCVAAFWMRPAFIFTHLFAGRWLGRGNMPLTNGDHPQNQMNVNDLKDLG